MTEHELKLPPIRQGTNITDLWVNLTPDGGLALRILRACRRKCDEKWEVHGVDEKTRAFYDLMNDTQDKRAIELDKAIAILERALGEPDTTLQANLHAGSPSRT